MQYIHSVEYTQQQQGKTDWYRQQDGWVSKNVEWKSPETEEYILHDSIYTKFQKRPNLQGWISEGYFLLGHDWKSGGIDWKGAQ